MRLTVYTAIAGDKDNPRTDILSLSGYDKFQSPVMNAKIYKVLPHKFLDCDVSFWMDGNITNLKPAEDIVQEWLGDNDIVLFRHYKHKNIDWELKMIKYKFSRRSPVAAEAEKQIEHYQKIGFWPDNKEVFMGGVIIRKHTPEVAKFNEAWWAEICRWGQRDQLSLPFVLKQFPHLKVNRIEGNIKRHPYFKYEDHLYYP
jgi:hypothetical protein